HETVICVNKGNNFRRIYSIDTIIMRRLFQISDCGIITRRQLRKRFSDVLPSKLLFYSAIVVRSKHKSCLDPGDCEIWSAQFHRENYCLDDRHIEKFVQLRLWQ